MPRILVAALCTVIFFPGCASGPALVGVSEETEVQRERPVPETVQPEPTPVPADPEFEQEKPDENNTPEEDFEVTEEVYKQTFQDIEDLINELNRTISSRNFDKWLTFLTEDYKKRYSDPEVLAGLSKQPTLQKYEIRLTSLEDYFRYVVVPSRSEVRLDDIVFTDEEHVKAIMDVDDQRVILYRLEFVGNKWKIGLAK